MAKRKYQGSGTSSGKRRRIMRKIRKYGRRRIPNSMAFAPLGRAKKFSFRYSEVISLNPTVGAVSDYVFSTNGMFDPNVTGTGHQPYGFDQMMALWNHYTVIGSKITIRGTGIVNMAVLYIATRDSSTSLTGTDITTIAEQPGLVKKLLTNLNAGIVTVSKKWSARKFFNRNVLQDDSYTGTANVNPSEQAYFHVMVGPFVATDDLGAQTLWVDIDYIAVLREPKVLASS